MKKIIALILIAVSCISLASCASSAEIDALKDQVSALEAEGEKNAKLEKAIIGKWLFSPKNSSEVYFQFNNDFSGKVILKSDESKTDKFNWTYDANTGFYLLFMESQSSVQYAKIDDDGKLAYYGQLGEKVE